MNSSISVDHAITLIANFRIEKENILAPQYKWKNIFPRCEMFDRKMLEAMLAHPDCNFISIYPVLDENKKIRLIAVCAKSETSNVLREAGL